MVRNDRPKLQQDDLLERVELPETTVRGLLRHFGPGLILMMTGVGTSHVVAAPVAGGRFEYALLWCIPVAYLFKYYAFEMAFRFTHATGRSMLDAYATAWRKWPLWYVLVTTVLQCALGQAGRLIAAAAVLYSLFSEWLGWPLPLSVYALLLGTVSVWIILRGHYRALELTTKVMGGVLFVSVVAVYVLRPAPLAALGEAFIISTPPGSWLVIAAFLGLFPTGIDVSLQASEWGKAKRVGTGRLRELLEQRQLAPVFDPFAPRKQDLAVEMATLPVHAREYCRRWFRIGLLDFATGYVISFMIAAMFLLLAAVWIYPSPVAGRAVIGEISGIFTRSVGPGMMLVFLLGALAALFSTALNYFDGWPRVVGACARNLFRLTAELRGVAADELTPVHRRCWYSEYNIYRGTMFYSLIAAVLIIAGVPEPVWLVLVASALAFFVAPVIYFLNLYYCVTVIPRHDVVFYPSRAARWFGWISLAAFTTLTVIGIVAKVFGLPLVGT